MKITNKLNLPEPFVSAVTREYQYKDKQYSATAINGGTCEAILKRRHDDEIEQDVSDMIWLIFGTAVHSVLENAQETIDQLKENKIVVDIFDGYKLSGIFDLYDDSTGTVTDYKTASVNKVIYNDWEDYRRQTLIYVWMLRKIGFEKAHRGEIVAVLKDFSKGKAKAGGNYPQSPAFKIGWDFTENDLKWINEYIYAKYAEIEACESVPDDQLPPCSPSERWQKKTSYAVMKEGRKTAVKVCDSREEAEERVFNLGAKHYVQDRHGTDSKCDDYCAVNQWCPYYRKKMEDKNARTED